MVSCPLMEQIPQHRVEYGEDGEWVASEFDNPSEAYDFWLWLPQGIRAKLYQNGILTGEGSGLESSRS